MRRPLEHVEIGERGLLAARPLRLRRHWSKRLKFRAKCHIVNRQVVALQAKAQCTKQAVQDQGHCSQQGEQCGVALMAAQQLREPGVLCVQCTVHDRGSIPGGQRVLAHGMTGDTVCINFHGQSKKGGRGVGVPPDRHNRAERGYLPINV